MTDLHDDLPDLDPAASALLAAYRRERAMPPAARARVRERLGAGAPDMGSGTCSNVHVLSSRRRASAGWAVGLALAAAVALWFSRRGADLAEQTAQPATMSPAHGAADNTAEAASVGARPIDLSASEPAADLSASELPSEPPALEPPAPEPEPEPEAAPPAAAPAARDSKPRRDDKPRPAADLEPVSGGNSLRDEQELLARGWQALADGQPDLAARDAAEHARRFPAGVLTPERRALTAVAACLDASAGGAELARAFLADHPKSPLARRVREACEPAP